MSRSKSFHLSDLDSFLVQIGHVLSNIELRYDGVVKVFLESLGIDGKQLEGPAQMGKLALQFIKVVVPCLREKATL